MIRRAMFVVTFVALAAFVAPMTHVEAQTFSYGSTCQLTVVGPASGDTTVQGAGFRPNFATTLSVNGVPKASATTDAVGAFSVSVNLPVNAVLSAPCDTDGSTAVLGVGFVRAVLTLSETIVHRLQTFIATVTGARPGSTVSFFTHSEETLVGTSVAGGDGVATLQIAYPASAALGAHEVRATGTLLDNSGPFDLTASIQVIAEAAPLSRTGSDITGLVPFGIGAVAIGSGLVLATRRRRNLAT